MLNELIVLGQDGIDIIEASRQLMIDVRTVLQLLGTVVAIGLVLVTYIATRAIAATLGAVLLAAGVLWGIYNPDFLRRSTDETIRNRDGGALIVPWIADAGERA
ncbi:MAG TPA: hypothetical protein VK891_13295 [Euzebyales bacterium]|nr:hypothetical protein [Euzebyales bacterium]